MQPEEIEEIFKTAAEKIRERNCPGKHIVSVYAVLSSSEFRGSERINVETFRRTVMRNAEQLGCIPLAPMLSLRMTADRMERYARHLSQFDGIEIFQKEAPEITTQMAQTLKRVTTLRRDAGGYISLDNAMKAILDPQ